MSTSTVVDGIAESARILGEDAAGTLEHVPPGSLLLERNIRDAKPSPGLVDSVKQFGVLEPITAVTSPSGLVVRHGHRRTLAALEAGRDTVPVYVTGVDDLDQAAEVLRVISQRDENTQREALTASDEVGVVEQLVAFGLSVDQITAQARLDRKDVDHAVTVSGSKLARKAAAKWDALTLDQAAAVVEFEDDDDLVKKLIVLALEEPAQFPHYVQRARDDRKRAADLREAREALEATGVTVIERPPTYGKIQALEHLLTSAGKTLTLKEHKTCAGHVAWLTHLTAVHGCSNPTAYGHKERYPSGSIGTGRAAAADMSPDEREKAKKARKLVIENNKAWDSALVVRREWLSDLAKRKTAPKGAAAHIAAVLAHDTDWLTHYNAGDLAGTWLGTSAFADAAAKATEGRALLIALVQVLGKIEGTRTREDWRQNGKSSTAGRHLRFLQSIGYPLSDVEKYAVSARTGN